MLNGSIQTSCWAIFKTNALYIKRLKQKDMIRVTFKKEIVSFFLGYNVTF